MPSVSPQSPLDLGFLVVELVFLVASTSRGCPCRGHGPVSAGVLRSWAAPTVVAAGLAILITRPAVTAPAPTSRLRAIGADCGSLDVRFANAGHDSGVVYTASRAGPEANSAVVGFSVAFGRPGRALVVFLMWCCRATVRKRSSTAGRQCWVDRAGVGKALVVTTVVFALPILSLA